MVLMMDEHPDGLPKAKGIIGDEGTSDPSDPSSLPLPQTMASRVIEVDYPQHLQCHPSWTAQMDLDALDKEGCIEKKRV